ncbi:MAG: PDZ domain-containing protein [Planctomycetota bacterium]
MRSCAALFLAAALASAGDLPKRIYVVRIRTERSTFHGTTRQTIAAPALPVDGRGLLMAVGFSIDPPDNDQDVIRVSAIRPDGEVVPARLLGGDEELSCTFFRLDGKELPPPVPLVPAPLEAGDPVVLLGRHGPLMNHAPRRITAHIDAVAKHPTLLYALREPLHRWVGSIATTQDGRLVGFLDTRPSIVEGSGVMLGVGTQTLVVVSAESFAELARRPPGQEIKSRAWIGVNLAPFDENREAFFGVEGDWPGALVTGVSDGSPAAKAGISVHDLVQSIGSLELRYEKQEEWNGMLRAVQRLPLNTALPCRVIRFLRQPDGTYRAQRLKIELTLTERPLDFRDAPETEVEDLGLKVKPATMDWRRTRQVPDATTGVVVTRTARASPTQLAGLRPEDLIVRVDDQPVRTVRSFVALIDVARRKKQGKLVLFVRRGAVTLFVAVTTNW